MQSIRVSVVEQSQVAEARRVAVEIAKRHHWNETEAGKVAIATTEAATNLVKHGRSGEMLVRYMDGDEGVLEIVALDKGPGMRNVEACFRDGYSTGASPGTGLGAMSRQSSHLDIYSMRGQGSAILMQFRSKPPARAAKRIELGGLSVAMPGEEDCGDAWSVRHRADGCDILVVDGLGHGRLAADAARLAVRAFEEGGVLPPANLLENLHYALRSTRGAAGAVASISTAQKIVTFSGIGNIAGTLVQNAVTRHLVSMSGILGHGVRSFREFVYPWAEASLLVLHSDGIGTRWDLESYPGLATRSPSLIAGVLYRDFSRGHDDATVVVAREAASP